MKHLLLFLLFGFLFTSCYSPRYVDDLQKRMEGVLASKNACDKELRQKNERLDRLEEENTTLEDDLKKMDKMLKSLEQDTLIMGRNYRRLKVANADLTASLEKQIEVNRQMNDQSEKKNKALYNELLTLQKELESKEAKLDERNKELNKLEAELGVREQRVMELQRALNERDSIMNSLKDRLTKALVGYEDKGISVRVEGNKVYVSMEEQILFASGKYQLGKSGQDAILDLAEVLNKNPDIHIMVEGHTDNVPIKTACIADNYELSVLRATEITRILVDKGKVDPKRIIAAGRGEHMPVASNTTPEGRKKNRRTEIILTPDLSKLIDIIGK